MIYQEILWPAENKPKDIIDDSEINPCIYCQWFFSKDDSNISLRERINLSPYLTQYKIKYKLIDLTDKVTKTIQEWKETEVHFYEFSLGNNFLIWYEKHMV